MESVSIEALNRKVLVSMAGACTERYAAWKRSEVAERKALWLGRFLLLAPVSGGVLCVLWFAGQASPLAALLSAFGVYLQSSAFLAQFIRTETRWNAYAAAGEVILKEAKELNRMIQALNPKDGVTE